MRRRHFLAALVTAPLAPSPAYRWTPVLPAATFNGIPFPVYPVYLDRIRSWFNQHCHYHALGPSSPMTPVVVTVRPAVAALIPHEKPGTESVDSKQSA